jgi:hypothetical protein
VEITHLRGGSFPIWRLSNSSDPGFKYSFKRPNSKE